MRPCLQLQMPGTALTESCACVQFPPALQQSHAPGRVHVTCQLCASVKVVCFVDFGSCSVTTREWEGTTRDLRRKKKTAEYAAASSESGESDRLAGRGN
jgi:hypothetical protein